ncbi:MULTISPECIES: hypothetical protein [Myxococcus]|nr:MULTISPECIES: hypothetical protein [Myxococcus]NOJ57915.1 hypothetical protein [Myxococcus xanthus]QPM80193.1 hypothetical protein I5Q59_02520 [Myxococcus xanthus]QVW69257.1 hypothetical protein JTM82_06810 [Myxococcus xanthus DZ2]UEO04616.1 hypothetical protein K1515_36000 [Myxococcus xanthus DZ2]UYI15172.1 hypothetical protein N3T43_02425 [Myxococcus xanthus]
MPVDNSFISFFLKLMARGEIRDIWPRRLRLPDVPVPVDLGLPSPPPELSPVPDPWRVKMEAVSVVDRLADMAAAALAEGRNPREMLRRVSAEWDGEELDPLGKPVPLHVPGSWRRFKEPPPKPEWAALAHAAAAIRFAGLAECVANPELTAAFDEAAQARVKRAVEIERSLRNK